MRGKFFLILLFSMLLILVFSVLITYSAVRETQSTIYKQLLSSLYGNNKTYTELKKSIELYRAFFKNRAVEITRKSMSLYLAVIFLMTALLFLFVLQITKPLSRLALMLKNVKLLEKPDALLFKERGSYEIRTLIRSINEMAVNLREYQDLVGDKAKYQGWKEISRIIVHEINNLVSPVETYSSYLIEKVPDNEREIISLILSKLGEIKEVLLKFRNLSHLPEPVPEFVSVNELIKEAVSEFERVSFSPCCKDISINVDRVLFAEILRNIIKNGLESKQNASVNISVLCSNSVDIIVEDDGKGIPEDLVEKIYKPGFTTKPGNIGIGLALSKRLAEEMGLKIEISSTGKTGTVFKIKAEDLK
ncbi:MAG: HAMP domain-containing histidine kinase [Spirochaetales bacterium]|nr:HAMP domain-containing histidine kinase [Spirochaetales bacterium]